MKRLLLKIISLFLIAELIILLTACAKKENTGTGYLFTCTLSGNPQCIDPQYTDNENAETVIANIMEGLLQLDAYGRIVLAGAESYQISEDGLTYEFKLRNDCYWYHAGMEDKDAKPVTSKDYVFAFRRLLDPDTHAPHANDFLCIQNASDVLAGKQKTEKLGVSAPNGATVVFKLEYPNEEFLLLLTQNCAVPCNEDFFISTRGRYGLSDDTILCNGAFYLTKWLYDDYASGNFLTFRKNSLYHDADQIAPSSLQFNIMRSQSEVDEEFSSKNSDCIFTTTYPITYLNSSNYTVITNSVRTWGLIFNPENETLKNNQLRQALAKGINRETLSEHMNQNFKTAYGIIPPAVQILGRSYRELYADEPLVIPYEPAEAGELFDKISLPMNAVNALKILIPDSFDSKETILAICQEWQTIFGQYIGIESVSYSEYQQRLTDGDYSIALYSFKPECNSCENILQQISEQSKFLGLNSQEFRQLLNSFSDYELLTDKFKLYGEAEQIILNQHVFIPLFYQNSYLIHASNNKDIWFNPFSKAIYFQKAKHFS
ncbi:MAG: peptide ABC transporter substrate-binding protein [Oscillospiraceae bacterium]|nr:peptide ABC transporter substrate-binding protein [Oscillospiraceae bacterium]